MHCPIIEGVTHSTFQQHPSAPKSSFRKGAGSRIQKYIILAEYRMFRTVTLIVSSTSGNWHSSSIFESSVIVDSTFLSATKYLRHPIIAGIQVLIVYSNQIGGRETSLTSPGIFHQDICMSIHCSVMTDSGDQTYFPSPLPFPFPSLLPFSLLLPSFPPCLLPSSCPPLFPPPLLPSSPPPLLPSSPPPLLPSSPPPLLPSSPPPLLPSSPPPLLPSSPPPLLPSSPPPLLPSSPPSFSLLLPSPYLPSSFPSLPLSSPPGLNQVFPL